MKKEKQIPITYISESTSSDTHVRVNRKIYVRAVKGIFETLRRRIGFILLLSFMLLPWLTYNDQQAILLDFSNQRFHLFSLTMWPQDLSLFAWLFIISAIALFFITVLLGRVWCGFICPQTVFTFIFIWVEELVEGKRSKRIHLDNQKMNIEKLSKKVVKHSIWLLIALITSLTFVSYFTPAQELFTKLVSFEIKFWPSFFVFLFMFCTYLNAGFMREIMCTHICPYSRFQSTMFDRNTVTVTYNSKRGDGRGPRFKKLTKPEYNFIGLGDCIDCNLCVQVCPAGIDIRNGLQYECINCGACVDACNDVMSKMGYEKDLIQFTSEAAIAGEPANWYRPKAVGYFGVLVIMIGALVFELINRRPLDIDIVRDRTNLYNQTFSGIVENVYTVVLKNKSQNSQVFKIEIRGLDNAVLMGPNYVNVPASQLVRQPVTIAIDPAYLEKPITEFYFATRNADLQEAVEQTTFIYK